MADGSTVPANVTVEYECGSVTGYVSTDTQGNFGFQAGGSSSVFSTRTGGEECTVRASLAGFQSDSIILGDFGRLPGEFLRFRKIDTIYLHPIGEVEGYTFSITTAMAPDEARKAYETGLEDMKKERWVEAEHALREAVTAYPNYAVGWYELGRAYQRQGKIEAAIDAYETSIRSDSKFIEPYGQLAGLAALHQEWSDVIRYTSQLFRLNPFAAPDMYFFSAVAHYRLGEIGMAESDAREAARLDTEHRIPKIHHLLGVILAETEDHASAAESLRLYLKLRPDAPDADSVNALLFEIEKADREGRVPE